MTYLEKSVTKDALSAAFDTIHQSLERRTKKLLMVTAYADRAAEWVNCLQGPDVEIISVASGGEALAVAKERYLDGIVIDRHIGDISASIQQGISATVSSVLFLSAVLSAQPVAVRQMEGEVRGFAVLRTLNGEIVADGDSTQVTHGGQITNRLTFHFKDGSLQDETVVFTQNGHFRVLSDHLVQKGPTFKHPMDVAINTVTGQVTVIYKDDKGEEKV